MRSHFSWQSAVIESDLGSSTKLVLLVIGSYMDLHGGGAFPSYATIAKKASLGRATVIRHVEIAASAGWLEKTVRTKRSDKTGEIENTSNEYRVAYPHDKKTCPQSHGDTTPSVTTTPPLVSEENQGGITERPPLVSQRDPNTPSVSPQLSPQKNKRASKAAARDFDLTEIEIPDWLPEEAWADWAAHRKAVKAPMTKRAAQLCITRLTKLRASGNDPVDVINQSIITGRWTDLYPLKPDLPTTSSRPGKFNPSAYVNRNRTPRHDGHTIDVHAQYVD